MKQKFSKVEEEMEVMKDEIERQKEENEALKAA